MSALNVLMTFCSNNIQANLSDIIQLMDEEWQILNSYSMRGWSNISFIQPRQVISDEAVGRVGYHLGEAE